MLVQESFANEIRFLLLNDWFPRVMECPLITGSASGSFSNSPIITVSASTGMLENDVARKATQPGYTFFEHRTLYKTQKVGTSFD